MEGYDGYTTMTFARERRVLTVTFNRPAVLNAVSAAMHSEMARLFYDIATDRETDIVVLTGAGRAFCAGGDMDWLQSAVDDISVFDQIAIEAKQIVFGLLDLEKPVICRLNGDAVRPRGPRSLSSATSSSLRTMHGSAISTSISGSRRATAGRSSGPSSSATRAPRSS